MLVALDVKLMSSCKMHFDLMLYCDVMVPQKQHFTMSSDVSKHHFSSHEFVQSLDNFSTFLHEIVV